MFIFFFFLSSIIIVLTLKILDLVCTDILMMYSVVQQAIYQFFEWHFWLKKKIRYLSFFFFFKTIYT